MTVRWACCGALGAATRRRADHPDGPAQDRTDLGREFGATDVVAERGEEGNRRVRELTGGDGTHVVLEAVGMMPAYEQAIGVVRAGGTISRVGVPQYEEAPVGFGSLFGATSPSPVAPAPVRAYIEQLLPDVLDGTVEPGQGVRPHRHPGPGPRRLPGDGRPEALKVLIQPWRPMTTWTADLARFGDQRKCEIAGRRRDGALRTPVIVWVVRVGDDLYTRSVNGPDAAWFRGVQMRHRGQLRGRRREGGGLRRRKRTAATTSGSTRPTTRSTAVPGRSRRSPVRPARVDDA